MKNILFIGPSFYDFRDEFFVNHLKDKYQGLAKQARVFVIACGRPFHKKMWGCDFYLLPGKIWFLLFAIKIGAWLCFFKKINTIVCQSPLLEGYFGFWLKTIFKTELIVEVHGDWDAVFLTRKRKWEWLQKKIARFFVKFSFKKADKVRVVARYLLDKSKKMALNARYYIFPTYTDLTLFFNEKNIAFEKIVLFVGVLCKIKGVDILIQSFQKISRQFPDFKLLIVGEGHEKQNYQLSVVNYQLGERVEFLGKIPLEQVKNLMAKCYCLVLPSLSEGMPRVIMEAMALGKPVIGSDVGGMPEIIEDGKTGLLFEKGDSNDLAENLEILLSDENLAIKMGSDAKKIASLKFSTEKYIADYLSMINE